MVALTEVAFKDYSTQSYLDMVRKVYRGGDLTIQQLIADVLEEVAPIEVIKAEPKPEADARKRFYMRDDFKLPSAVEVTTDAPPPEQLPLFADEEGPDAFLMRIAPRAIIVAQELGIDPRIVAAQAALETGWGKSVKGNNLFGIKSHGKADGLMVQTHEVLGGKRQKITDSFRQYESFDDSIEDYGLFLRENKRYQPMLEADTLDDQITALGKSGYATDPEYAKKISDIAKSKRLEVLVSA
jgi:flagellum-specific peptidoglycan hydrolase FlgJ